MRANLGQVSTPDIRGALVVLQQRMFNPVPSQSSKIQDANTSAQCPSLLAFLPVSGLITELITLVVLGAHQKYLTLAAQHLPEPLILTQMSVQMAARANQTLHGVHL